MADTGPAPTRRRRWLLVLGFILLGPVLLILAFPYFLQTKPAQDWMKARAEPALAPGKFQFDSVRFSWFGPTRLTNFTIFDGSGDRVVAAAVAHWDRTLWQALTDRHNRGTMRFEQAVLDIERRPDGSVDLYDALKPILNRHPGTLLHIEAHKVKLRFRDRGLPAPVISETTDIVVDLAAAPKPLSWRVELNGLERARLEITGAYNRWQPGPPEERDLFLAVAGEKWPLAIDSRGWQASGIFDGQFGAERKNGHWESSGNAAIPDLDVSGTRLAGDHLRPGGLRASWNVARTGGHWTLRVFDVTAALGTIKGEGNLASVAAPARLEGTLDLAALAQQIPRVLRLREGVSIDRGEAKLKVDSSTDDGRQVWNLEAHVAELRAKVRERVVTLQDPATISARLIRERDATTLERMAIRTAFLDASGQGDVDRGIDWSGRLDLTGLRKQLGDLVEFGKVELAGKGPISGKYRRTGETYDTTVAATIRGVRVSGLGSSSFGRDAVQFDLAVNGAVNASGIPLDWQSLKLTASSQGTQLELTAKESGGARTLTATGQASFETGGRKGRAEGRLDARWEKPGVAVERLVFTLTPSDGPPIALAARGNFNPSKGELTLQSPTDDHRGEAIAIAPEGIQVAGIIASGTLRGTGALVGDVGTLSRFLSPRDSDAKAGPVGTWSARGDFAHTADGARLTARVDARGLGWSTGDGQTKRSDGPISLTFSATAPNDFARLDVGELVVASPYATIEGAGHLANEKGHTVADLSGTLRPDWAVLNKLLAEKVEPKARLSGKARAWRLRGALDSGPDSVLPKGLSGELGLDLLDVDIYGLRLGPTSLVLRPQNGAIAIDPIDTSLNQGRIHLEPSLILDDARGPLIRMDRRSSVTDAQINEEVSSRFLSFVAPVLDRATRTTGRVSVNLDEAVFPLGGDSRRTTSVTGAVVFQDVEVTPGPFMDPLFDMIGRPDLTLLKLNDPVALSIADRRVYQRGLAIPIGRLTRVELDGWVDFDRNIALTASVPVTPTLLAKNPLLNSLIGDAKIKIPIRGTLRKPQIDKEAADVALKDLGRTLLERGVTQGLSGLLQRLARPRDPNAPPPPTREERRNQRQERRTQRRLERGMNP